MKPVQATWLATIKLMSWRALDRYGVNADDVFRQAGLDPAAVSDPDARYPVGPANRLWKLAVAATGDPCFGLKLAQHWHPSNLHALGFAWMASHSLRDAFERLDRYWHVVLHSDGLRFEEAGSEFKVIARDVPDPIDGFETLYDAYLAVLITMCRALAGAELTPTRVALRRSTPSSTGEYFTVFRCPVEFNAGENSITLPLGALDAPLPTANPAVAHASDKLVMEYLSQLERDQVGLRVRAKLVENLPSGHYTAAEMASELHLSARTLQRRLRAEGTNFNALVEQTRRDLAKHFMRETRRSVGDVAYSLGFSEVSNFSRAFKRWTGVTPTEYRDSVIKA